MNKKIPSTVQVMKAKRYSRRLQERVPEAADMILEAVSTSGFKLI